MLDKDLIRRDKEEIDKARAGSGGNTFFSIPYGKSILRVLPRWDGTNKQPYLKVVVHFGVVTQEGSMRVYKCTNDQYGNCPICDRFVELRDSGEKDKSQDIRPQKYYLYNILDATGKQKVLTARPTQHDELIAEILDDEGDLTSLDNGGIFQVTRNKTNPYCRAKTIKKGPVPAETRKDLHLKDLTQVYIQNTPDELAQALEGKDVNGERIKKKAEAAGTNGSSDTSKLATGSTSGQSSAPITNDTSVVTNTPPASGVSPEELADMKALLESS